MATETFFMLLVFAACFWYLGTPLVGAGLKPAPTSEENPEREKENLLSQKEEVLESLKEIEMDYQMQKISEEDYKAQYAETFEEGKSILKKME